jgi:SNF2 family DNA or RNA helicase
MISLLDHQEAAVRFVMNRIRETGRGSLLDMDTGTGKTAVAIKLFETMTASGQNCFLVTVPGLDRAFLQECKKMQANFVPSLLSGNIAERWTTLAKAREGEGRVYVGTYEMFKKKFTAGETRGVPTVAAKAMGLVVFDESHLIKNIAAQCTIQAVRVADGAGVCVCMSGNPMLNGETDYFSQVLVCDPGVFGRNDALFYATWLEDSLQKRSKMRPVKEELKEEFKRRLASVTFRVRREDVLTNLPPLVKKLIPVEMMPHEYSLYKAAERDFLAWLDNEPSANVTSVLGALSGLRKLVNVRWDVETNAEGLEVSGSDRGSGKGHMLMHLLETMVQNKPVKCIVWVAYRDNADNFRRKLERAGYGVARLIGGGTSKQKDQTIADFRDNPEKQILIATPGAAGTGLNLQFANIMIYHGRDYSLGNDIQSEGRAYRKGSEIHDKVYRLDLYYPNTIDEVIMAALQSKKDLVSAVRDYSDFVKRREAKTLGKSILPGLKR